MCSSLPSRGNSLKFSAKIVLRELHHFVFAQNFRNQSRRIEIATNTYIKKFYNGIFCITQWVKCFAYIRKVVYLTEIEQCSEFGRKLLGHYGPTHIRQKLQLGLKVLMDHLFSLVIKEQKQYQQSARSSLNNVPAPGALVLRYQPLKNCPLYAQSYVAVSGNFYSSRLVSKVLCKHKVV